SVKDKNKKEVVNAPVIDNSLSGVYSIIAFDGKQLLVYNQQNAYKSSGTLLLYKISKKGLTQAGSYAVERNYSSAQLTKSGIILQLYEWGSPVWNVVALQRRLKKQLWRTTTLTNSWIFTVTDNGVVSSYAMITNAVDVKVTKKGKPFGRHLLSANNIRVNNSGSIIYWTHTSAGAGPLTLINRSGKVLADNFLLEDMANFGYCWFTRKLLYLRKTVDGTNTTIRTYTVTSKFKLNGEKTGIMNYNSAHLDGGKAYVVLREAGDDITMLEYKKKLDKVAWENTGPTHVYTFLGNAAFIRTYSPSPNETTYTIFKRDKNIVTHEYPEP
ncbi:MAG: hypothetical protein IZT57_04230, partial [Chloroflexi bacterium]|nr:hypothetical protein [Chloroflexota bacterium]